MLIRTLESASWPIIHLSCFILLYWYHYGARITSAWWADLFCLQKDYRNFVACQAHTVRIHLGSVWQSKADLPDSSIRWAQRSNQRIFTSTHHKRDCCDIKQKYAKENVLRTKKNILEEKMFTYFFICRQVWSNFLWRKNLIWIISLQNIWFFSLNIYALHIILDMSAGSQEPLVPHHPFTHPAWIKISYPPVSPLLFFLKHVFPSLSPTAYSDS